jgi:8-oxo-dGTP pyrophosphatase MutT (NUDIX family)
MDSEKTALLKAAMDKLKPIKYELISSYEEGYIGKKVYNVYYADGMVKRCEQITKNKMNGDAVVIIPITDDNKYVMIVEARPNTKNAVEIEFPAGMVDEDENPVLAAKRELLEETGYDVLDIEEIEWHYQDQGCGKAIIRTYLATGCKRVRKQDLDSEEKIEVIEMTYEEILELIKKNELNDANSKIAFMTHSLKMKGIL